jgi:hypothetical protein
MTLLARNILAKANAGSKPSVGNILPSGSAPGNGKRRTAKSRSGKDTKSSITNENMKLLRSRGINIKWYW